MRTILMKNFSRNEFLEFNFKNDFHKLFTENLTNKSNGLIRSDQALLRLSFLLNSSRKLYKVILIIVQIKTVSFDRPVLVEEQR